MLCNKYFDKLTFLCGKYLMISCFCSKYFYELTFCVANIFMISSYV